jgi:UPF0716 protein FxsA|tara:strand:+ start:225 stop:650 length:426 start_codon:yes stop_codon:yes gene_type:complete
MNALLLIIIGFPILEILIMIKVGQQVGAINTILLILLTAIVGIYYARIEGLNTIRSGFINLYKNKIPVYEMISGASIAIAAILLIIPGFVTDIMGFFLLFPFSRRFLVTTWIRKNKTENKMRNDNVLDGEIIDKKDKQDDL